MYQKVSIVALIITLVIIFLHRIFVRSNNRLPGNSTSEKLSLVGQLSILVYLAALFCFIVLAITGFYPTLILGEHITGYLIMVHATFAPIFAVCLAVLAVMWARRWRFTGGDWPLFERIVRWATLTNNPGNNIPGKSSELGRKISFWLVIFLALPLILSIILSMYPLFGTHWQEILLGMHRYTALVFAMVAILHTYFIIRT
jgi:cytochrome b subunit of formate dehydrogenase